MATVLKHSVGRKAKNNHADVVIVQHLLNQINHQNNGKILENGICDGKTINAIVNFQTKSALKVIDGRVDIRGATIVAMLKEAKNATKYTSSTPSVLNALALSHPILELIRYLIHSPGPKIEVDHKPGKSHPSLLENAEFKMLVATVYGEAANSSETAWQAVAFVIKNRVGNREWARYKSVAEIVKKTGFDAYTQRNSPYVTAEKYLNDHSQKRIKNAKIDRLVEVLAPVYTGEKADITNGSVLYYSPKAQGALHKTNPQIWKETPAWNFAILQESSIPGLLSTDDFKFYRYK